MQKPAVKYSQSVSGEVPEDPDVVSAVEIVPDALPKVKRTSSLPMNYERRTTLKIRFPDRLDGRSRLFLRKGQLTPGVHKSGGLFQSSPSRNLGEADDRKKRAAEQPQEYESRHGMLSTSGRSESSHFASDADSENCCSPRVDVEEWIRQTEGLGQPIPSPVPRDGNLPENEFWKEADKWVNGPKNKSSLRSFKNLFRFEKVPKSHS